MESGGMDIYGMIDLGSVKSNASAGKRAVREAHRGQVLPVAARVRLLVVIMVAIRTIEEGGQMTGSSATRLMEVRALKIK